MSALARREPLDLTGGAESLAISVHRDYGSLPIANATTGSPPEAGGSRLAFACSLVEFAPFSDAFPSDLIFTRWLRAAGDIPSQVGRERCDLGVDLVGMNARLVGCPFDVEAVNRLQRVEIGRLTIQIKRRQDAAELRVQLAQRKMLRPEPSDPDPGLTVWPPGHASPPPATSRPTSVLRRRGHRRMGHLPSSLLGGRALPRPAMSRPASE